MAEFGAAIEEYRAGFRSRRHLMLTMGTDFSFQDAGKTYKNIDKLIRHMNEMTEETGYNLIYSTPSCYIKAVNEDNDVRELWPEKTDDFFPYCDEGGKKTDQMMRYLSWPLLPGPDNYWTGYYTTRPSYKYLERISNAMLQSARQVNALLADGAHSETVVKMEWEVGIAQHHDGITGTAKQAVDDDYRLRLYRVRENTARMMGDVLFSHVGLKDEFLAGDYFCPFMNVSGCALTQSAEEPTLALIYNPMSRPADVKLRIPVADEVDLKVTDMDGQELTVDTVPLWYMLALHPSRLVHEFTTHSEAWFTVPNVPPMGETN